MVSNPDSPDDPNDPTPAVPKRPIHRQMAGLFVKFALIPYVAITILFTLAQRRLIYHPPKSGPLSIVDAGLNPDTSEDVTVTTDDGLTLHGWLLRTASIDHRPSAVSPDAADQLPPLVIYFCGNAACRAGMLNDVRDFTQLGCDVLIVDYRGYAENPGTPGEPAMRSDARAIWTYATGQLQVPAERIVLFGESLGGAVAVSLAEDLCRDESPPAALITNAAFDSIPRLSAYHYPLFPFRWLVWDRWPSVDRIPAVTCPVLMFHGTGDQIVPIQHGRRLFAAAPGRSSGGYEKRFVEIPGAGHNNVPVSRLHDEVRELLNAVMED